MARIIVTGASGYIARHAAAELVAHGVSPRELILVTRTPHAIRESAPGAEVRVGDFTMSEADLQNAYAGAERMLFISPAPESFTSATDQLAAQQAALAAASKAGVRHVVMQSRLAAHPDLGGDKEATELEATLRKARMHWTLLRTGGFADSRGRDAKRNLQDGYINALGDPHAPSRYVTRNDIAAAAAAVLLMGDSAAGHVYHLLGPGVSLTELVDLLSDLSGRALEIRQLDEATYVDELVARGRSRRIAELAVVNGHRARELAMRLECDLPGLIGRPGQSLLDFLRANQTELLTGSPQSGREPVLT